MRRKESLNPLFTQRIPADVKARAAGMTLLVPIGDETVPVKVTARTQAVRLSLRTSDPDEAKVRQATVIAHLERVWRSIREKPRTLSQKEAVALAGELYRQWTDALEDNPGNAAFWRSARDMHAAAFAGKLGRAAILIGEDAQRAYALEECFGGFADVVLSWKALKIDAASRANLLEQVARVMDEAAEKALRNAEGDYRPDENVARFPEWKDEPKGEARTVATAVTITGLFDAWSREAAATGKAAESTLKSYGASVRKLVTFLGHDDAARVTPENVVAFKDARLAEINPRNGKPVSAKTVNDGDLAALKTVFGWGASNRKLAANPATGITVPVAQPLRLRSKGFTETEALALLKHAWGYKATGAESAKMAAAKHWVPWLCAFTGARLGEMVQLRKEDLKREGEVYMVRITPEAGTVKGRRYRDVPLHPQLVELGFPAFVQGASAGHLFITPTKGGDWRGAWRGVKNRVTKFARQVVTDPQVQPSHGWRHRFVTLSRQHGVDQEIRRMITGHKGAGVDEKEYGDPAGLYREVCKMPRYEVA